MKFLLTFLYLLFFSTSVLSDTKEITVEDIQGNEINITTYPSNKDRLIIWLINHTEKRETFDNMFNAINASGAEIWRVNLLESYFMTRTKENQLSLSGDGVFSLIKKAHDKNHKTILLVASGRSSLALLRGVRKWQLDKKQESKIAGAVLFYPNLFGPTPLAGEKPILDPIVEATNIPIVVYQPESGRQRWHLKELMNAFWKADSPAFAHIIPEVRDWFYMGDKFRGNGVEDAIQKIPDQLKAYTDLMASYPKPTAPVKNIKKVQFKKTKNHLVEIKKKTISPNLDLTDFNNKNINLKDHQGKVILVNFWATWCPPCVEEIPSLNKLGEFYKDQKFKIISVDFQETPETLMEFSKRIPINFPVLLDLDGKVSNQWKIFSFPSSFIIDKKGFIRYSVNQAIEWNHEDVKYVIDELLNE